MVIFATTISERPIIIPSDDVCPSVRATFLFFVFWGFWSLVVRAAVVVMNLLYCCWSAVVVSPLLPADLHENKPPLLVWNTAVFQNDFPKILPTLEGKPNLPALPYLLQCHEFLVLKWSMHFLRCLFFIVFHETCPSNNATTWSWCAAQAPSRNCQGKKSLARTFEISAPSDAQAWSPTKTPMTTWRPTKRS